MSSTPVVLYTGLDGQSRHMRTNETSRNDKKNPQDSGAFPEVKHKHDDPVIIPDYALVNKFVIYVARLWAKSTHQQISPQQST